MAITKIGTPELFDFSSLNTALQLPTGPTSGTGGRPSNPSTGEWRYNTTLKYVEYYDGAAWFQIDTEAFPNIARNNFNTVLWDGNNTARTIPVGFQPDLIWLKNRNNSANSSHRNLWYDSVRTVSDGYIHSDGTSAQEPYAAVSSFASTGFNLPNSSAGTAEGAMNDGSGSGGTYVGWCWRAGGAPDATNTNGAGLTPTFGSIMIDDVKSTAALLGNIAAKKISANTSSGFSIVQWEGTGTTGTVAHCLSSTPELILTKNIDFAANDGWPVFTTDTGNGKFLQLNTTSQALDSTGTWNQTDPNSTVFTVGNNEANNRNNNDIIAYCFHSVTGYQKIGTYAGNGNNAGTIVDTGFTPSWLMIKSSSTNDNGGGAWIIYDNERSTSNPRAKRLFANVTSAELNNVNYNLDFLTGSTKGFQPLNGASGGWGFNTLNVDYIYLAIA
jgi:hypothetical protein